MSLALTVTELMSQAWSFNQERSTDPHAYSMLTLGGTAVLTTAPKLSTVNLLLFLTSPGNNLGHTSPHTWAKTLPDPRLPHGKGAEVSFDSKHRHNSGI